MLGVGLPACSDDADRIDQSYGSHVGEDFHLDGASASDAADAAAPAVDAGADAATDAGVVAPDAFPADAAADGGADNPG
ncbi:MAG TPA: hypothetical protein VF454_03395 [Gemmatimonadales bacterium]